MKAEITQSGQEIFSSYFHFLPFLCEYSVTAKKKFVFVSSLLSRLDIIIYDCEHRPRIQNFHNLTSNLIGQHPYSTIRCDTFSIFSRSYSVLFWFLSLNKFFKYDRTDGLTETVTNDSCEF